MKKTIFTFILLGLLSVLILGLESPVQAAAGQKRVILATSSGIKDSGLLDVLVPLFERKTGCSVKVIAVGSGQAMAMGRKGEADVLLVNSPEAEKKFMADRDGIGRRPVMYNDFIIVGAPDDAAKVRGLKSSAEAFRKIARAEALFISRGDNSGTHAGERIIWERAAVDPERQKWYRKTGRGMGQTLEVAAQKQAYTLTDRGTYLSTKKRPALSVLVEGDDNLLNIYHVIEVNPHRRPKVNAEGAKAFADFMVSEEVQEIIGRFGVDEFGSPLFFPAAGKKEEEPGK